jgi:hypothetical protein
VLGLVLFGGLGVPRGGPRAGDQPVMRGGLVARGTDHIGELIGVPPGRGCQVSDEKPPDLAVLHTTGEPWRVCEFEDVSAGKCPATERVVS